MFGPASSEFGHDFQRRDLENVLAPWALPARHGRRKNVGEAEEKPRLVRDQAMLEQAKKLLLALVAVDVVEEFQRRLRAPAQKETGEGILCRPLQNVGDFRPERLLLDAIFQCVDPGDDKAVELPAPNFAERAVEFADMVSRGVLRMPPLRDAAHVGVRRDEGEVNLQHGVAEPEGELALRRDLIGHQVDDGDLQRADVLLLGAALVDRQRAAKRGQKGMDFLAVDDDGHCGRLTRNASFWRQSAPTTILRSFCQT